jgi:hypothetical protein
MVDVSNIFTLPLVGGNWIFIVSPLYKAIVYTQVKLPPLIPQCFGVNRNEVK